MCIHQWCISHAALHINVTKLQEIALESDWFFHQRRNQGDTNSLVSPTGDGTEVISIFVFYAPEYPIISTGHVRQSSPWSQRGNWADTLLTRRHMLILPQKLNNTLCLRAGVSREANM